MGFVQNVCVSDFGEGVWALLRALVPKTGGVLGDPSPAVPQAKPRLPAGPLCSGTPGRPGPSQGRPR